MKCIQRLANAELTLYFRFSVLLNHSAKIYFKVQLPVVKIQLPMPEMSFKVFRNLHNWYSILPRKSINRSERMQRRYE